MFSSNNIKLFNYEGFDNNTNSINKDTTSSDKIQNIKNKIAEKMNDVASQMQTSSNSPTTSTPASVSSENDMPIPSKINVIASSSLNNSDNNATTKKTNSVEGFDLQSTENNIKRGKQSNSIPVNPSLKQSVDVAPYEGQIHANSFNEGFSLF
jgi:hypothetical protein